MMALAVSNVISWVAIMVLSAVLLAVVPVSADDLGGKTHVIGGAQAGERASIQEFFEAATRSRAA